MGHMKDRRQMIAALPQLTVIGLGPGGLSATIEAAKLGLRVVAFTKKQDYVRGQRFKLAPNIMGFLDSLENTSDPLDASFFDKMVEDNSIQVKDLEQFLRRKLEDFRDLVTIIELDDTNPITAIQHDSSQNANYLSLADGTRHYFTHLIGSEGAKRTVANLVKTGLEVPIEYQNCTQERHPYHASVQLFANKHKRTVTPLQSEADLGWPEHLGEPASFVLTDHQGAVEPDTKIGKFSFAGEIPESIFTAPEALRADLLKNWAILQIAKEYSEPALLQQLDFRPSQRYAKAKDKVKACAFTMHLSVCTQAAFKVQGGYYAPIGDARRTPNYTQAHGLHDAILAGIEFARCIRADNTFDVARYEALIAEIDAALQYGCAYFAPLYTEDPRSNCTDSSSIATTDCETDSFRSESPLRVDAGSPVQAIISPK